METALLEPPMLLLAAGSANQKQFVSLPHVRGVSVLLLSALTVSADHPLTLKISEEPVMTGSDVTLYCENVNGDFVKAYFYFNGTKRGSEPQHMFTIHKVQQSDEGLYSCSTDEDGKSPQVWLRVKDPPTTFDPPHTTSSSTMSNSHTTTVYTPTAFNYTDDTDSSSFPIITVVAVLCSLVLVVFGFVQLWRKQTGMNIIRFRLEPD
ncbi:hypothetical protein Q5P01_003133 [Channa striata]|uniref:Ig-like domain-containing protein n=1 Tax=Channa striata TaxID=64152 RepID=A0AA88TEL1_CHASR|nr:hypothetical protein Q5P01_003133 [Channa striata]